MQVEWNADQLAAIRDVFPASTKFHLLYGGSGSGKSLLIMYLIVTRAMAVPGSRHGIFRYTRKDADEKLFSKTLNEALALWPGLATSKQVELRSGDLSVQFSNGSKIVFGGLDENRKDGILGDEYHSIWINECNQPGITYAQVSHLVSRLRSPPKQANGRPIPLKMYFDCNPQWKSDWEHRAFIQGVNPIDGTALGDWQQWTASELRPHANVAILGEGYIETMAAAMTAADRRRFIEGKWSDNNPDALFVEEMFNQSRTRHAPAGMSAAQTLDWLGDQGVELDQVIVSGDPAVTNDVRSDSTGIIVAGVERRGEVENVYVLDDLTMKGTPDQVCQTIAQAYADWGASRVILEKNQGGLWLESTLRKHFTNVPLEFVTASATTGGKASRAEPVSAQYERKIVHHVGKFEKLEEQMCDWGSPGSRRKSPDRMDALVWGVTWLLNLQGARRRKPGATLVRAGNRLR